MKKQKIARSDVMSASLKGILLFGILEDSEQDYDRAEITFCKAFSQLWGKLSYGYSGSQLFEQFYQSRK